MVGSGTQKIYLARIMSIVFNEGTKGIAIAIEDITDRKNARLLEQKYNHLLDIISDTTNLGILILKNESVIFANKTIERLFGFPCQGIPLFYLLENIVPEDRDRISKIFMEHPVGLRKNSDIIFSLEKSSGSRTIVNGRIVSFDEPGEISCFLLVTNISG